MKSVAIAALVGVVAASPVGDWKPNWHFSHKPPGWSTPSVYTPANPPYPTLSKYPGGHSSPSPTGYPTSNPTSPPSPTGYPTTSPPAYPSSSTPASSDACATVSSLASSFLAASPSATPTVPASIAHDCITSVPFNQSAALALLDTITPYVDWQTTIEYLREPPAEYAAKVQPAYDFYGFYAGIVRNATQGVYQNEYEFGMDLYYAFQMAHDGHFVFYPDSVTGIFSWGRQTPLVSISDDGSSIPQIYVYADVLTASFGNATFTPSPVTGIDGQDSIEFLLNWSQVGSLQDRDALWNNLFYTPAQVALGSSGTGTGTFSGGGRGNKVYPGPVNTLTFANGTTIEKENFARVLQPFDNITSGADIYKTFFAVPGGEPQGVQQVAASETSESSSMMPSSTSNVTMSSSAAATATPTSIPAPAYPSPFIRQASNQNSGYFLDGEGYDDVAVLAVNSFVGAGGFQNVNTYLIDQAVARNKSKLIIDVSANGGGTILQGYDLFKQLFPQILPYGATRFRAHEAFDLIGREVSAYAGLFDRELFMNETDYGYLSSAFNYRTDADIDYQPFDSWAEKFGPHAYGPEPDNFTSIIRWNLSDVLTPDNSGGIYVSGYLNRSNITTAPFAPENIVVVYDGYCASTCTIFSELMRQQAGIQTIALGGRPNTDIIQAVGGVKGTNDFGWDSIFVQAEYPFILQQLNSADYYNSTALGAYTDLPLLRGTAYAMNVRDGIREGDESGLPLQFVYEPADCRIFYTAEMVVDETSVWKTVADSAFNGVNHCVAGGLNASSGATPYKRGLAEKHKARRDVDLSEHWSAMREVWTGRGGGGISGDSKMIL